MRKSRTLCFLLSRDAPLHHTAYQSVPSIHAFDIFDKVMSFCSEFRLKFDRIFIHRELPIAEFLPQARPPLSLHHFLWILPSKALNQAQKISNNLRTFGTRRRFHFCRVRSPTCRPSHLHSCALNSPPSHRGPLQQPGLLIWRLLLEHLVHRNLLMPTHHSIRCSLAFTGSFANFHVFFSRKDVLSIHTPIDKAVEVCDVFYCQRNLDSSLLTSDALISARGPRVRSAPLCANSPVFSISLSIPYFEDRQPLLFLRRPVRQNLLLSLLLLFCSAKSFPTSRHS